MLMMANVPPSNKPFNRSWMKISTVGALFASERTREAQ